MPDLTLNGDYQPILGLRETERAIKFIKDYFQDHLAAALNLQRVSASLFLKKGSDINDDLNGIEAKATFRIKDNGGAEAECLFSLAKWKRMVLADYGFGPGEGLYTDILLHYPLLGRAFEISLMGIRVNGDTLLQQLGIRGALGRREFERHKRLLAGELPLSIGGGIGQSRLCMFLLRKLHLGEVHASAWPQSMVDRCRAAGVTLL